jgi:hypothetical protein
MYKLAYFGKRGGWGHTGWVFGPVLYRDVVNNDIGLEYGAVSY